MEHCSDCGKGTLKVGDPKGVEIKLNNISVYQAKPLEESDKAILYLHDIAGWKFNNARLLADLLATETGCHVFIPDLFEGEIIRGGDFSFMEKAARKPQGIIDNIITKFHFVIAVPTIIQFVSKFPLKRVQPTLDSIIEEIKKNGNKQNWNCWILFWWETGFCFRAAEEGRLPCFSASISTQPTGGCGGDFMSSTFDLR